MPEFGIKDDILAKDVLLNYPGDGELSEWMKKNKSPLTTEGDVDFFMKYLVLAIDHMPPVDRESLQNIMQLRVSKDTLCQQNVLEKSLVAPIGKAFDSIIKEVNEYQTLPIQIRSWMNSLKPKISCQLPTIFFKLILDRAQIDNHIRVRTDAAHPYLMVEGQGKYFAIDFYDKGGRVRELSGESWGNETAQRDQAFLSDTLSAMRFLDYGNVLTSLFARLDECRHGSNSQIKIMELISKVSDEMGSEFGNSPEIDRYFEMTRTVGLLDRNPRKQGS